MKEMPNPDKIDPRFVDGLDLYLNAGIRPGDFLTCVLCNDLQGAIYRADIDAQDNLKHIVAYMYEYFPSAAWGSVEKVHTHFRVMAQHVYGESTAEHKKRGYPPDELEDPFYKIGGTD